MTSEIQVLAWDRHINVAVLNQPMGPQSLNYRQIIGSSTEYKYNHTINDHTNKHVHTYDQPLTSLAQLTINMFTIKERKELKEI